MVHWSSKAALPKLYKFFIPETKGYQISGSAKFFPAHCKIPAIEPGDTVRLAAQQPSSEGEEHECMLDQVCNRVVHPVTQETITKYEKLANDPIMKDTWTKAMCNELGRLAQDHNNKEGTNTIFFMTIDEIKQIAKDRTVTYALIVVEYRPQKDDPNS
jgi:hypothetical protein